MTSKYQLFRSLSPEQYQLLKADIKRRGVQVPIEVDNQGNILDGHHRKKICDELRIECPEICREFASEKEKREHVLMLNMGRRQLAGHEWGMAFMALLEVRGVGLGRGKRNDRTSVTLTEVAKEFGVSEATARRRIREAQAYSRMPSWLQQSVDANQVSIKEAVSHQLVNPDNYFAWLVGGMSTNDQIELMKRIYEKASDNEKAGICEFANS